jgi:hypothetical protein
MNLNEPSHSSLAGLINATRWSRAESFRADPVSIVEALTTADKDDLIVTWLRLIYSQQDDYSITSGCRNASEAVVQFLVEREAV